MSYIFGGNTGETPESLARRRAVAEAMMARATSGTPQNIGEGLNAVGQALAGVAVSRRADRREAEGREQGTAAFDRIASLLSGDGPSGPSAQPATQPAIGSALPASLVRSESGGDFLATNDVPGSGGVGHFGRGQFSQGRMQDAMRAGVLPEGTTPEQFLASPEMQQATEQWHVGDVQNYISQNGLDRYVGQQVGGTTVTPEGMLAVAHLGGNAGLQRFLESGGQYNPADANGTRLSDYLSIHGAGGSQQPSPQVSQAPLPMAQIMQELSNPWLTDSQRSVAQSLLQQSLQDNDPMRQLQLEREQLEIDQLRQPSERFRPLSPEEAQQMGLPQNGAFQIAPDGRISQIGGGGTNVTVNSGSGEVGTIPQGYELFTDPETGARQMREIPGGPEDTSAADQARRESTARTSNIILEDIGRIREMVTDGGMPTTGPIGSALSVVPGTDAHDISHLGRTIRANIGFDRLQQMREASPTGGALGNVTVQEIERLESVLGALGQSQTQDQFLQNLNRLEDIYTEIHNKAAAYPNAADFGFEPVRPEPPTPDAIGGMQLEQLEALDHRSLDDAALEALIRRYEELGQ